MVTVRPRSDWTDEPNAGPPIEHDQTHIYIHYPGNPLLYSVVSDALTAAIFRDIRSDHVSGEYNEIAYNWGIDPRGQFWELRGKRQSGANGGSASNDTGQAILCLVGNTQDPTPEMIRGVRECITYIRNWQHTAGILRGHRESPDADTACPGDILMGHLLRGDFGESYDPATEIPTVPGDPDDPVEPPPIEVGLTVDGRFGQMTVRALQRRIGATVDGKAGNATWRALQRFFGTTVDGTVSKQSYRAEELGNGITQGWEYVGRNASGSNMVRALQRYLGLTADGIWFEGTTRALQSRLNDDDSAFRAS